MPKVKKIMLKAELKEELFHGLELKYNLNKNKLEAALFEDLQCMKEKDDEEFRNVLMMNVELTKDRFSAKHL